MGNKVDIQYDVIVVDDRPSERDEIADAMRDVPCKPLFYSDISAAFTALLEQAGTRLLVNFQLTSRDSGWTLLRKMHEQGVLIPTIVMDCENDHPRTTMITSRYEFVKDVIDGNRVAHYIDKLRAVFLAPKLRRPEPEVRTDPPKIFVIHGRNLKIKARIINILKGFVIEPVVLSGEPVMGASIFDELNKYSDVDFAIALFTGDDQGREVFTVDGKVIPAGKRSRWRLRARQNVVLETGLLSARIGKEHVRIFLEEGVELPSDLSGIRYISLKENDRQISDRLKQIFDELGWGIKLKRT